MSRLDLQLIRAFVAIYETRSVTRASERLALAQPTLSHSLLRLRKIYADRLFLRGEDGLVATGLADQLYERFGRALDSIDSTLEPRERFEPKHSTRRFQLSMSDSGLHAFAGTLLQRFHSTAPRMQIEIEVFREPAKVAVDLASGRLDVAIGNLPSLVTTTHHKLLFRERYVCLVAKDHPRIQNRLTLRQFASAQHIALQSPTPGNQLIDEALAARKVVRQIVARAPHFLDLPRLLLHTDLLIVLPSRVAALYMDQHSLKAFDLPLSLPEFEVRAHWHVRNDASKAHRWLIDEVIAALG